MSDIDLNVAARRRVLLAGGLAGGAAVATAGLFRSSPAAAQGFLQAPSLLQVLERARDLSRFAAWVKQAGLEGEFAAAGDAALFVPHDEAIKRLSAQQLAAIEQNRETLTKTLRSHLAEYPYQILAGGSSSENAGGSGATIRSRAGSTIVITNSGGALPRVNNFAIFVANMRAANGIAHCIDGVLGA